MRTMLLQPDTPPWVSVADLHTPQLSGERTQVGLAWVGKRPLPGQLAVAAHTHVVTHTHTLWHTHLFLGAGVGYMSVRISASSRRRLGFGWRCFLQHKLPVQAAHALLARVIGCWSLFKRFLFRYRRGLQIEHGSAGIPPHQIDAC
jgi:hypothetical protein